MSQKTRCFHVTKNEAGEINSSIDQQPVSALESGEVLVRVSHSSLNYKDAMAATGHRGIVKSFPHVPGIDAVGTVVDLQDDRFSLGDTVIATGHELGVERWGGWSTLLKCPGEWLVPLPDGLTTEESMLLGTAGFTAAQCVQSLIDHQIDTERGKILVTGATGGVGSLSVMLLSQLGYHVVAITGKTDRHDWLSDIGASEVVGRDVLAEEKPRPLHTAQFAGAIDTVGGPMLASLLKYISHRGCVACCGVAGGAEVATTVYPFILRGVTLSGIDSAWCPDDLRAKIWKKLATNWKLTRLEKLRQEATLQTISTHVDKMLQGQESGRVLITIQ